MNDNSVIILTKEVEPNLNHVHHRMPLLIDEEKAMDAWLDPNLKFVDVIGTVMNKDNKVFKETTCYKIGPTINKLNNKTIDVILPFDEYMKK